MKLDAMLGYAEAATCRRRVLLAYFDEESDRLRQLRHLPLTRPSCGTPRSRRRRCSPPRSARGSGSARVTSSTCCAASARPKIEQWQHDELPTFGIGVDISEAEWRSVVRQLVARSVLSPDPARMGALQVTEAARPILDGNERVELRRLAAPVGRVRKEKSAARGGAPAEASDSDRALFEVLRTERRVLADAESVPAYVVLPDRTLWELVAARPRTTDELLAVNGIGPVKAEKYGTAFLTLLAEHGAGSAAS